MATTIIIKNSAVSGKVPDASVLQTGELAINLVDQKLYSKDASGNVFELGGSGNVGQGPTPPITDNEIGDLWWDGDFLLVWNGSSWEQVGGVTSVNGEVGDVVLDLGDLNDVSLGLSGPSIGDIIAWNGTNWVSSAAPPADISGSSIGDLNDVDVTGVDDGDILVWNDSAGEWQAQEMPPGFDPTGYLKSGDKISELDNDVGYITASDIPDFPEGSLQYKGTIDVTAQYPAEVKIGDLYANTGTGTPRAEWVGLDEDAEPGDLVAFGGSNWAYIGKTVAPDLDDYVKKGDSVTELTNDAVYLKTDETAADSEKLCGEDCDYYLNYQNLTNTPDLSGADLWTEDSGKLYPTTLTNKVGIGTTNTKGELSISGTDGENPGDDPLIHFDISTAPIWAFRSVKSNTHLGIDGHFNGVWRNHVSINRNSGNVGLGVEAPAAQLDIRSGAFGNNQKIGINLGVPDGQWMSGMFLRSNSLGQPRLAFDVPSDSAGATDETVSINNLGYVGIGTTSPIANLEIGTPGVEGVPAIYLSKPRPALTKAMLQFLVVLLFVQVVTMLSLVKADISVG